MGSPLPRRVGTLLAGTAVVVALGVGGLVLAARDGEPAVTAASTLPPTDLFEETTESAPPPPPTAAPPSPATTVATAAATPKTAPPTTTVDKQRKPRPTRAPTTTEKLDPISPPADPRGPEESVRLGGIAIPKLGVDAPLFEGIRLTTLDLGPGHWPGTAMPGNPGNVVVAAHRTSHGGPFRYIDALVGGDEVIFTTEDGPTRYLVTSTEIVSPSALWIVDQTDNATATLFACHPPGSVAERIVVHLELAVD